jgi:hypothetical protein
MPTTTMVLRKLEANGPSYGIPTIPGVRAKMKFGSTRKILPGNIPVDNNTFEFNLGHDNAPVVVNGVTTTETLAISLRISGSQYGVTHLQNLATALRQVETWISTQNVMQGYVPSSVPTYVTP